MGRWRCDELRVRRYGREMDRQKRGREGARIGTYRLMGTW